MTGINDGQPGAHALIVAIDEYNFGGRRLGLTRQALDLYRWLIKQGVHPRNVTMLTSPRLDARSFNTGANQSQSDTPGYLGSATGSEITQFLYERLPDMRGAELFIFWSGHGVVDDAEDERLFVADASVNYLMNLNLRKICHYLRGNQMQSFSRQLILVDACQTRSSSLGYEKLQADLSPPESTGEPPHVRQDILVATPIGRDARFVSEAGGGLFTDAILGSLQNTPADPLLPDASTLLASATAIMREQQDKYPGLQDPVKLSYYNERGTVRRQSIAWGRNRGILSAEHMAELSEHLSAIQVTSLIDPAEIIDVVWSSRATYSTESVPFTAVGDLQTIVDWLDRRMARADGLPPVLAFALHLALRTASGEALQDWVDSVAVDLNIEAKKIAKERVRATIPRTSTRTTLTLLIDPYKDNGRYVVNAWLHRDGSPIVFKSERQTSGVSDNELQSTCQAILDQLGRCLPVTGEDLTMEFVLPWDLLNRHVDKYQVDSGGQPANIGIKAAVVVRSLDRLLFGGWYIPTWKMRWRYLTGAGSHAHLLISESHLEDTVAIPLPVVRGADDLATLKNQLEGFDDVSCLILSRTLRPDNSGRTPGLEAAIRAGVPAALWCDGECDSAHLMAEVSRAKGNLASLPKLMLRWRKQSEIGGHVAILWDDPNRLPRPIHPLTAPSIGEGR